MKFPFEMVTFLGGHSLIGYHLWLPLKRSIPWIICFLIFNFLIAQHLMFCGATGQMTLSTFRFDYLAITSGIYICVYIYIQRYLEDHPRTWIQWLGSPPYISHLEGVPQPYLWGLGITMVINHLQVLGWLFNGTPLEVQEFTPWKFADPLFRLGTWGVHVDFALV